MAIEQRAGLLEQVEYAKDQLQEALGSLQTFLNPDNKNCDVPPEARQAAKLYLETWVQAPIEAAIALILDQHPCYKCEQKFSIRALNGGYCKGCLRA